MDASYRDLCGSRNNFDNVYSLLEVNMDFIDLNPNKKYYIFKQYNQLESNLYSYYTKDEDYYAIYDSVVVHSLPKYIKRYLNEDVKPKEYINDYNKFSCYIDRIIEKAYKEHGNKISRNGFDHLVWYYHKGRQ